MGVAFSPDSFCLCTRHGQGELFEWQMFRWPLDRTVNALRDEGERVEWLQAHSDPGLAAAGNFLDILRRSV